MVTKLYPLSKVSIKLLLLLLVIANVFLLSSTPSFSQAPSVEWYKCIGSEWIDNAQAIDTTSDGGYIIVGTTNGNGGDVSGYHGTDHGVTDIWIVKLSSTGTIQWQKCIGGTNLDFSSTVHQTPDGGYIVGGSSSSNDGDASGNSGNDDCWILKLTGAGNIEWQKTFGGSGLFETIFDLQVTPDGGYIATGLSNSTDGIVVGNHGGTDVWVVKLSANGTLLWQKNIGGSSNERGYSIEVCFDGGYLVTGSTSSNNGDISGNHGEVDLFIAKLANDGTIQWSKCFGGSLTDQGFNAKQCPDGSYIAIGITLSNDGNVSGNHGVTDIWVVKLDASGNLVWQKCYGSSFYDFGSAIVLSGTGYVIAGYAEAVDGDVNCHDKDYWLFKITSTGTIEWQKTFGGNQMDQPFYLQTTRQGGWIAAGITTSTDLVGAQPNLTDVSSDVLIVKFTTTNIPLPPPIVSISPSSPIICEGTITVDFIATIMNGGNNAISEWFVNGISVGTGNNYTAFGFANNDTLICVADVTASCIVAGGIASDTVIFRVNPVRQPSLTIAANSTVFCSGSAAVFTSSLLNGGSAPFYQWRVNGMNAATGNSFTSTTLKNGDLINCEYSDSTICMSSQTILSNTIQVEVSTSAIPEIDISTGSTVVCSGTTVLFNAVIQNAGTSPTYQWKLNGTDVGTNSPLYNSTTLVNGDRISCVLTADPLANCLTANTAISDTIAMVIRGGVPPAINVISSTNNVCYGTAVQFNAVVSDVGNNPTIQWRLNGADVGTNTASYSNSKLKNGDIIQCLIKPGQDACSLAEILSFPVTMTIYDTSAIRISPSGVTIKYMETIGLSANITGSIRSFQWTPANQLQNPQSLSPVTIPLTATTNFNLTVINSDGCVSSSQVIIKVSKPLELMPNAFTPNGDGKNDVFRIPPGYSIELNEFSVFDRWGNMVFTTKDISKGWDGNSNGKKSPSGTYVFFIKGVYEGKPVFIKDNIVLVR